LAAACRGRPSGRTGRRFNLRQRSGPVGPEGGAEPMWEAVREAIKSNGTTVRFIVIIVVLACVAWVTGTTLL